VSKDSIHAHARLPVGATYRGDAPLRWMLFVYTAFFAAAAVVPLDRQTWLLENGLVFAVAALMAATHRRFSLSVVSYAMLFVFFMLHAVGSHYTYSLVPAGDWVRDAFGLERNHYDRLVHFAFGLLFAYPLRELCLRLAHLHRIFSYLGPPLVVLALSSVYEIIESWAAQLADPAVGMAYVGAQGDVWDGQKDMTLALLGAVIAMVATAVYRRWTGHEPYLRRHAGGE
jgi:putative membrane protein